MRPSVEDMQQRLKNLGLTCNKPLAIKEVATNAETIGLFKMLELTFHLDATYDNPFDAGQIDVMCHMRSPSGRAIPVPAFFYQDYGRLEDGGFERKGQPVWKVRFTPVEVGRYEYVLTARDRNGQVKSPPGRFECVSSEANGFIRVSRRNPYYFEFDSHRPYVPIGINLFVSTSLDRPIPADRLERCERFMQRMATHGGNFVRLRMDSWFMPIEMTPDEATGYLGLGYYDQRTCREVDQIYDIAKRHSIYIMHCLDNANANVNLREHESKPWRRPYNLYLKENGGVIDKHEEFWTNAEIARSVKNKLRYCVARWGYSTNCMCWEFWNEVYIKRDIIEDITRWHRDMARTLREIDPYDHPVTTSIMGNRDLHERIFSLSEIEIAQCHMYKRRDIPLEVNEWAHQHAEAYQKPFFLGEFGADTILSACASDDIGLHLHNGVWAPMMAGMSGPGAPWYVEPYLDKQDLYGHFKPAAEFSRQVPWTDPALRRAHVSEVRLTKEPREPHYVDFTIPTSWTSAHQNTPDKKFVIKPDGQIPNSQMIQPALFGSPARGQSPIFVVNFTKPGKFLIEVKTSVGDETNALIAYLDGDKVVEKPFPAGRKLGKKSVYVDQYNNWRTTYDETVQIPVPAGQHEIRPEMRGKDRIEVSYALTDYLCFEKQDPIRVMGLQTNDAAYLWMHNKSSTWYWRHLGKKPIAVEDTCVDVMGLTDGNYSIQWWDTWKGHALSAETIACREGRLQLSISRIERDVACIVQRREQ